MNVLAATRLARDPVFHWGPEIEWVALDNLALELEVPMVDAEVEALKGGFQTRVLTIDNRRLEVGVLAIGYHLVEPRETVLEPGAVVATRFTRALHGVTIVGPTAVIERSGRTRLGAMVHPSLFYQVSQLATLGVELGHRARCGEGRVSYALPQLHLMFSRHAKVQLGAGLQADEERTAPLITTRVSVEL